MASTTGKNRSILAGLMADAPVTETPTPTPARETVAPERLTTRMTGLARVTAGDVKEKTLKLVDPSRCRMWARHNRRYDLLSESACSDLLESLRAQGEQEFPAIVRRVEDDPAFDYEVICGARRHWSVSYLRTVEHRDIRFLIEERDLSDEAAFRLADVENRSRKDICDYERALDYRSAVEVYYGGVAQRMAERLEVSKTWLSRFLDLAKLPVDIIEAFGDVRELRENHAREIKPLLAVTASRPRVMAEAKRLAALQATARETGEGALEAPKVILALKRAASDLAPAPGGARAAASVITNAAGAALFTLAPKGAKKVVLELALDADASNEDFHLAFQTELDRLRPQT
jgi:ParB family chromosome partitioning protein